MELVEALKFAKAARINQQRFRKRQLITERSATSKVVNGKLLRSFCSNDYLGLSQHPRVREAFTKASLEFGVGSGASHLVDGHTREHHRLEEALADFTGRQRALIFSTGYMANIGLVTALLGAHMPGSSCVVQDKLNHASLIDAGRLSGAEFLRFNHSDLAHLERRLRASSADKKLIAVDGVYSMDGDLAPLPEICNLAKQYSAWVMVDDAHGFACLGRNGGGSLEYFGLTDADVPVLMGTFGKALGTFGAFAAGSEELIDVLVQYARTYIYTTALPPGIAAATRVSLALTREESWRRTYLQKLISRYSAGLSQVVSRFSDISELNACQSLTAIQPLIVGSETAALSMSERLVDRGFWVSAIRPPTVPIGTSRLRVTLCADHTEQDVDDLINAIADCLCEVFRPDG